MTSGYLHFFKENKPFFLLLTLVAILKIALANYGNPYLFHADEPYILKDPFKIVSNYSQFNFSAPTNLLFWIILVWFSIVFCIGLPLNLWNNLADFQTMLIGEDFTIVYAGRLLSVLFCILAYIVIYRTCTLVSNDKKKNLLFMIVLMLNPLELISNSWLKFDSLSFLALAILLQLWVKTFLLKQESNKKYVYLVSVLALSIRIDFIAFLIALGIYDCILNKSIKKYITNNKFVFIYFTIGVIGYCMITLYPISLLYNKLHPVINTSIVQPFEKGVSAVMLRSINSDFFINNIISNFKFYFVNCFLIVLGPVGILFIYAILKYWKQSLFFLLFLGIYVIPILIDGHVAPHYFLTVATTVLLFLFIHVFSKKSNLLLIGSILYIVSLSIETSYYILTTTDTRIASKDYLVTNTNKTDIIAIEGFNNYGFFPVIDETDSILNLKAKLVIEQGQGTGQSFLYKSKNNNDSMSRIIIEVSEFDRYATTRQKGKLINTFDLDLINTSNPKYYVTNDFNIDYSNKYIKKYKLFRERFLKEYSLEKEFELIPADPRVSSFLFNENYFPHIYVYKKRS